MNLTVSRLGRDNDVSALIIEYLAISKDKGQSLPSLQASQAPAYHHGDLRQALLEASIDIIRQDGLQALSLRKLAEVVGVSRTAPYHHFKDKNALIAAVSEQGFVELSELLAQVVQNPELPLMEKLKQAVLGYVNFAIEHPMQYELMFGRDLWKDQEQEDFQRTAKNCFRQYVHLFEMFQAQGILAKGENPLRLAQLMWATLHGLAKLASDGIFANSDDLEEIAEYALSRFEGALNTSR